MMLRYSRTSLVSTRGNSVKLHRPHQTRVQEHSSKRTLHQQTQSKRNVFRAESSKRINAFSIVKQTPRETFFRYCSTSNSTPPNNKEEKSSKAAKALDILFPGDKPAPPEVQAENKKKLRREAKLTLAVFCGSILLGSVGEYGLWYYLISSGYDVINFFDILFGPRFFSQLTELNQQQLAWTAFKHTPHPVPIFAALVTLIARTIANRNEEPQPDR